MIFLEIIKYMKQLNSHLVNMHRKVLSSKQKSDVNL